GMLAAFAAEDYAAMRAFLTEDHLGMPPARPAMKGRDEAEAFWREGFDIARSAFTSHAQRITVSGDWAIDRFGFVMTIEPRDGSPGIRDEGKCVWIWHREDDGVWRLESAIWNSDLAEPALWSGG
ncbi:MAG TPA: DUF4440 domain-containing protein, partial [Longimicrobiales bacterium]|nr:DUF4440 domain-containing protein [Longimicrobiales bacterium]